MVKPGDILIAKPFLQDGFFKRTVIYICENNTEGSLGFILNRPSGLILRDIFPHLKNGNFHLFEGGPVSPNQLFYTHTLGKELKGSIEVNKGVFWGGDFYQLSEMIEHKKVTEKQIRFYVGYSGWQSEQLKDELERESWFQQTTDYNQLIKTPPFDLWGIELCKINKAFKVFSDYAFDPSMN